MKEQTGQSAIDEQKLVRMYMDLTGTTEACARSVLIYASSPVAETNSEDTRETVEPA
jgi:hypothetical protein